ncbi:MAG: PilT/PilU family type 4a pilus ATPase [Desulfobacterales bacterium]|nr:PilT/PilU family type 4a pilus ATPase [Desulfobacterales bacterium]
MKNYQLDRILSRILKKHSNLSDINFTPGKPPQVESDGILTPVCREFFTEELTPFHTDVLALSLIGHRQALADTLLREGACDLSYQLGEKARFRVNIFSSSGHYSLVLRRLTTRIPSISGLQLPDPFLEMAEEKNGIMFFTGATGMGKTTSLAAILDQINNTRSVHIVTLEDPIEYLHPQIESTFNQRELGQDFQDFAGGLRSALRQAPKVILVGEMRDRETVEIGLSAAETGHLVLTSLHTVDAGQTINRILGMFEPAEERMIRLRLAETIRWIVSQRLLPRRDGGRVPAFEIMATNLRVRDSIVNGESEGKTFQDIILAGKSQGMITFDESILGLNEVGIIDEATAMGYASRRDVVGRGLDQARSRRGEKTSSIDALEIDHGYGKGVFR